MFPALLKKEMNPLAADCKHQSMLETTLAHMALLSLVGHVRDEQDARFNTIEVEVEHWRDTKGKGGPLDGALALEQMSRHTRRPQVGRRPTTTDNDQPSRKKALNPKFTMRVLFVGGDWDRPNGGMLDGLRGRHVFFFFSQLLGVAAAGATARRKRGERVRKGKGGGAWHVLFSLPALSVSVGFELCGLGCLWGVGIGMSGSVSLFRSSLSVALVSTRFQSQTLCFEWGKRGGKRWEWDGWMDEWVEGWMDVCVEVCFPRLTTKEQKGKEEMGGTLRRGAREAGMTGGKGTKQFGDGTKVAGETA